MCYFGQTGYLGEEKEVQAIWIKREKMLGKAHSKLTPSEKDHAL